MLTSTAGAQQLAITGKVLGEGGRPLAGAELLLLPDPGQAQRAALRSTGKMEPAPVASSQSAGDGTFRLLAPEAGFWRLVAHHPGHLDAVAHLAPLLDDLAVDAVELPRRREVAVQVVAADGSALAGVQVLAMGWPKNLLRASRDWRRHEQQATSGPDGIARLGRAADENLEITALHDGLFGWLELNEAASETRLVLDRPLRDFRLLDAEGRPAAGVRVVLSSPLVDFGAGDPQGIVKLPARSGPPWLTVLRGIVPESLPSPDKRSNETAPDAVPTISLPARTSLDVAVVEAHTQRPLAGALVWGGADHLRADRNGRVRIEWVPQPLHSPKVGAPGYFEKDIGLHEGSSGEGAIVVALAPWIAVNGRVVGSDGEPVAGAELSARRGVVFDPDVRERLRGLGLGEMWLIRSERKSGLRPVRTGPDGRFRMTHLAPWAAHQLAVSAAGFAPQRLEITGAEPGTPVPDLEITLVPGITAFGRVLDTHEHPIVGAEVALIQEEPRGRSGQHFPSTAAPKTATVTDGSFSLEQLAAGTGKLAVHAEGFVDLVVPGLELTEGSTAVDLGTVLLEPASTLEGRVVDAEGTPVERARVKVERVDVPLEAALRSRLQRHESLTTDAEGRFRIENLGQTSVLDLEITHPSFQTLTLRRIRVPADGPLRAVLEPTATLTAVVVDRVGAPVAGETRELEVALAAADKTPAAREQNATEPGEEGKGTIVGRVTGLELRLGESRALRGRVWVGGKPAAGVSVGVRCSKTGLVSNSTSLHDGSFELLVVAEPCQIMASELTLDLHLVRDFDGADPAGPIPEPLSITASSGTELRVELFP